MEDIIFAGTETRKPVSFASVSLTIDNSDKKLDIDYSEVTVTRRVFRSGESEYLLNGNTCRLKDINELFMIRVSVKRGILLSDKDRLIKY